MNAIILAGDNGSNGTNRTDADLAGLIAQGALVMGRAALSEDQGLGGIVSAVLDKVRGGLEAKASHAAILKGVDTLIGAGREAIPTLLSADDRAEWDGYAADKERGYRTARDARKANRTGMSEQVAAVHAGFERLYTYGPRAKRVVEALLTVPGFGDTVTGFLTIGANGGDRMVSATDLIDAARKALGKASKSGSNGSTPTDGETVGDADTEATGEPDTIEAIIDNATTRLRKIGRDDLADAMLEAVLALI